MAGVGGLAFPGELRVAVGPCLGVHLVEAESPAPVPALGTFPALDLPEPLVLPLDRFAEGLELYRRGAALKVVFTL